MRRVASSRSGAAGKVRIIAGQWRGSRLDVPDAAGLRPSSDRVRETLFNWLQAEIGGARCLDLFAGSGALGFEAASRGAAKVVMIERDAAAVASLRATAARLGARQVEIVAADALAWLAGPASNQFDIVFVDPPFAAGILPAVLEVLPRWLAPRAWLYIESGRDTALPHVDGFALHREGSTRDVRFCLLRRSTSASAMDPPATLGSFTGGEPAANP